MRGIVYTVWAIERPDIFGYAVYSVGVICQCFFHDTATDSRVCAVIVIHLGVGAGIQNVYADGNDKRDAD